MADLKAALPIRDYCDAHLERRSSNTYVCPICGSGTHGKRTAAFTIDDTNNRFKCFSCGRGGDILDLIGIVEGIDDKSDQFGRAVDLAGIGWKETAGKRGAVSLSKAISSTDTTNTPQETEKIEQARERERGYMEDMRLNLENPEAVDWLRSRGFTVADARAALMGYDPQRRRIIIPWRGCDYYHIDRSIDHDGDGKYMKPKCSEVGKQPLWNREAVRSGAPIFIVEGALDAIAVELAGFEAVALGGIGTNELMDALRGVSAARCVIMTDADERGEETARKLDEQLNKLGVLHSRYEYHDGAKDPADEYRLYGDADTADWYRQAIRDLDTTAAERYDAMLESLEVRSTSNIVASLFAGECDIAEPIPTGLAPLDTALGGGLPSRGLVIVGAISSMGKTTLIGQIADYIAASGRSVLFVTIEQGAAEIVAKNLSRMTSAARRANGRPATLSALHITSSRGRATWADDMEKADIFYRTCERYSGTVADRLHILESDDRPNVARIESVMRTIAAHDGAAPVVFIDYLQLLAPMNDRDTDKRNMDANVTALRQLATHMDACIVAVSTLNRSSYDGGISLDSYKESGSIEYGADMLLGLQPRGVDDVANDPRKKQEQRTAEIMDIQRAYRAAQVKPCEIVVLKNRNGALPSRPVNLDFDAMINTFTPTGAPGRSD